ncbi:unnamed protein product [Somion occarium]|uniref:Uncharacterized protein n=1 Tax=Somion occarium TaxID=3059160 RepID=A0ABP1D3E5_9APHY
MNHFQLKVIGLAVIPSRRVVEVKETEYDHVHVGLFAQVIAQVTETVSVKETFHDDRDRAGTLSVASLYQGREYSSDEGAEIQIFHSLPVKEVQRNRSGGIEGVIVSRNDDVHAVKAKAIGRDDDDYRAAVAKVSGSLVVSCNRLDRAVVLDGQGFYFDGLCHDQHPCLLDDIQEPGVAASFLFASFPLLSPFVSCPPHVSATYPSPSAQLPTSPSEPAYVCAPLPSAFPALRAPPYAVS